MISIIVDRIVNNAIIESIDLTRRLDDQTKLSVRNELERDIFEVTVSDVDLKISDLDSSLYDKFFTAPISTVWKLCIKNNNIVKFRGFLDSDFINRDQREEYFLATSFSTMRKFWDVAESFEMGKATEADNYYVALGADYSPGYYSFQTFLKRSYLGYFSANHVLQNIDIDPNVLVRSSTMLIPNTRTPYIPNYIDSVNQIDGHIIKILTNPIPDWVGNLVLPRYQSGTLKDLLLAVAKNNDSEWYIDLETETLKLRLRNSVVNNLGKDLSHKVVDSDAIKIDFSDQKRYDYVCIPAPINEKNIPKLNSVSLSAFAQDPIKLDQLGRAMGQYRYVLSSFDVNDNEISCGQFLTVITPTVPGNHISGIGDNSFVYKLALISLNIPALTGIGTVVKRRLYRTCDWIIGGGLDEKAYNGNFYLVQEWFGNIAFDYLDNESDHNFLERVMKASALNDKSFMLDLSKTLSSLKVWIRYDEDLGIWNDPIYDDGTNQPAGKIFDIKADLQFRDVEGNGTHSATTEELFYFFGGSSDYQTIQERWKDLMTTKRKVSISMQDNELNIGDSFTLKNITKLKGINDLIVKTASDDMITEESQLELITI